MPEIITTPNAFVQTTNGKRFYAFSGEKAVTSAETSMINNDNIGERDIMLHIEVGSYEFSSVDFILRIKSNGILIYNTAFNNSWQNYPLGHDEIKLILPANTSLEITLQGVSSTVNWTVACYGKYLSM